MIVFDKVKKMYPSGMHALKGVSFTIKDGEFVFIIGSSGAGKSTMTKLMMAEERLSSGEIFLEDYELSFIRGRDIPKLRRQIGVVFQDFRLIPTKTVYENIAFAMRVIGQPNRSIRKRVPYILALVGLEHRAAAYPPELSGGEQQRIALARAIANNPKIIIADEPTGNIDPQMSYEIMDLLSDINKKGVTVVVVTHEKDLVDRFGKRVITLDKGEIVSDRTGGYDE